MTRRAHGRGTVREDGTFQVTRVVQGKRIYAVAESLKEANAKLDEKTKKVLESTPLITEYRTMTLGEWLDRWLPQHCAHIKPSTRDNYEQVVRLHIKPRLGGVYLGAINRLMLSEAYHAFEAIDKKTKRVVLNIHSVLHRALKDLMVEGIVKSNAMPRRPAYKAKERVPWTAAHLAYFFAHGKGHRLFAAFRLAGITGGREGEILCLGRDDINLDAGTVNLDKTIVEVSPWALDPTASKKGTVRHVGPPKSNCRVIGGLSEDDKQAIRDHYKRLFAEGNASRPFIFCPQKKYSPDRPVSKDNFLKQFHALTDKLGLPRITFHDMRHTYATLCTQSGIVPPVELQRRLGHKDARMVQRYTHSNQDMQTQADKAIHMMLEQAMSKEQAK